MAFGRCALFAEFVVDAPVPLTAVLVEDHLVAALGHLPDGIGPRGGGAGSVQPAQHRLGHATRHEQARKRFLLHRHAPVSYTHLTLPTKRIV